MELAFKEVGLPGTLYCWSELESPESTMRILFIAFFFKVLVLIVHFAEPAICTGTKKFFKVFFEIETRPEFIKTPNSLEVPESVFWVIAIFFERVSGFI